MPRRGEMFEKAVYEFYKGVDPNADIRFDHRVLDQETGAFRQVDVWVTCCILTHLVVNVLISCKDHTRPLDVGEIDTFVGEIASTGATVGVLYSRSGFTENALKKARARKISCCRLFDNAPPERPSELLLDTYIAYPVYNVIAMAIPPHELPDVRWRDLPAIEIGVPRRRIAVHELITELCIQLLNRCQESHALNPASPGVPGGHLKYTHPESEVCPPLRIEVVLTWDWFRGTLDGYRHSGSLDATSGAFVGTASTAAFQLNTFPAHENWARSASPPIDPGFLRVVASAIGWPPPPMVAAALGKRRFSEGGVVFGARSGTALVGAPRPPTALPDGIQLTVHFGPPKPGPSSSP